MKYKGTLVSDLSGSLGGLVASRNKSGGFLRARVTPTNPRTEVQQQNRGNFAVAGSAYHALSPSKKANWSEYALNRFTPRGGRVPGVTYSGQNAYTSLKMTEVRSNSLIRTCELGLGAPSAVAPLNFTSVPPVQSLSANLRGAGIEGALTGIPIRVDNSEQPATMATNGNVQVPLALGAGQGGGATVTVLPILQDVHGNKVGFNVYMAENITEQEGLNMGNPRLTLLGSTGLLTFASGELPQQSYLAFSGADFNTAGRKIFPTIGTTVMLSVHMVSEKGESVFIGSCSANVVN